MKNLLDFTGKTVLVSGARSGIGKAIAIAFAEQGAKVVLSGRRPCPETAAAIAEVGGECTYIKCDVSIEEEMKNLVAQTVATYGSLDVAVNNAGYNSPTRDLVDQTTEDYERVMDIDAKGVFFAMKYEIQEMLKAGKGSIVNIASVAGLNADPGMVPYVGAKHAVVGMTKAAGIEYGARGIRVNGLAPGFVATEMTEPWLADPEMTELVKSYNFQHRIADPSEIAGPTLFLASDLASFMSGEIISVDAGQNAH